jgi:eukaryotic-like serine/threonine-protein kinase
MKPERWKQVEALFHETLDLPGEARSDHLARNCGGDDQLRQEVSRLIAAHERESSFMDCSVGADVVSVAEDHRPESPVRQYLGRYLVIGQLGRGGMAEVYLAEDVQLQRKIVLKVLPVAFSWNPDRVQRFEREAKAASALNHPNILTIHEVGQAEESRFIATEFVEGVTLRERMKSGTMSLVESLEIAIQVASALSAAHRAGIIHRDIKPENVMVRPDGLVKVLDFGLAKLTEQSTATPGSDIDWQAPPRPSTELGAVMGTVSYMSPEQALGLEVDHRTDIFSLGVLLYELVAGSHPFQGETNSDVIAAILQSEPLPVSRLTPGLPPELEGMIDRMLAKERQARYSNVAEVRVELRRLQRKVELVGTAKTLGIRRFLVPLLTILLLVVAFATLIWWQANRSPVSNRGPVLTRVTSDSGLTMDPAFSPDGKMVAYASDRGSQGNLDIWVRQIVGGEPLQLTEDEADDRQPTFSFDGSQIAFRSERSGGGIYVVSALGGRARLIASGGFNPRFSPNGWQIAYCSGSGALMYDHKSELYVVSLAGGKPRQLRSDFEAASSPIWSPDGTHLLFLGLKAPTSPEQKYPILARFDWWMTPVVGGIATRTNAFATFRRQFWPDIESPLHSAALLQTQLTGVGNYTPHAWIPGANAILFSAKVGDSINLWRIGISPETGQVNGLPQRVTFGTEWETQPSVASNGRLVFSNLISNIDVWSLSIQPNQGKVVGEAQRLTQDSAPDYCPTVSADGTTLLFVSHRLENTDIWKKDLKSGKESAVTITPFNELYPIIARDGLKLSYVLGEGAKSGLYVAGVHTGTSERVRDRWHRPDDWSSDGEWILSTDEVRGQYRIDALNLNTKEDLKLTEDAQWEVLSPHFSPDDKWVAFHAAKGPTVRRIFITHFQPGRASAKREWIPVTDSSAMDREPRWSPDGSLLYFLSERDGFRCLWAQRLDPATKHAVGLPRGIHHFHRSRLANRMADTGQIGLAVTSDKIYLSLEEVTVNLWMTKLD